MPVFSVLLLNDDRTPMEFVVDVLERFFGYDRKTAIGTMLQVHETGATECGKFPQETATAKVAEVTDFARQQEHPLQCVMLRNK